MPCAVSAVYALTLCSKQVYPNIHILLQILATLPVSTAVWENVLKGWEHTNRDSQYNGGGQARSPCASAGTQEATYWCNKWWNRQEVCCMWILQTAVFIYIVNYVLGSDTCFVLHFVCFCLISQLKSVSVLHIFYQAWKCCLDVARHGVAHSCVCLPHGWALQNGWTDGQSILAVLYFLAGYCKIGWMGQFCHFQWTSESWNTVSFRGLRPWPSTRGSAPGPRWGLRFRPPL